MITIDKNITKRVQQQMETELKRSMKGLSLPNHPRPFFMSYLLHHTLGLDVWGRYGAVFNTEPIRSCDLYAECRVGSYRLDQTVDGGLDHDHEERDSYQWLVGPQDLDPQAVRYAFWKLSQLKYQEALQDYYDKRKILVDQRLKPSTASLTREDKLIKNMAVAPQRFSTARWESFVRQASGLFAKYRKLVDPYVRIRGVSRVRVFVNSEGSKFTCQENFYEVVIKAWYLTDEGAYLDAARYFHAREASDLPKMSTVEATIDDIARDLSSLAKAKPLDPYAGPALLSGTATGLLFHEAIGHRLEGERMLSRSEGQTFSRKVGQRILPEQVDLIDDPTLAEWEGRPLYGHYHVDDEGVAAQRVELVKKGVLKSFLLSRSAVPGFKKSNGHGRHERYQDPMAR
ncbi:MAG: metallopeptidase TldD-related protein, partial [Myxococcota bacterium]